ncbi:hypothetical protein HMPREF1985_01075 [Mitsuokella sp. oral taxon 131 str. W9106]|nr:hypothetical protein HMPREF1985_01075 [Mitsuokella sp. oral taxon 131 str. W9106]
MRTIESIIEAEAREVTHSCAIRSVGMACRRSIRAGKGGFS